MKTQVQSHFDFISSIKGKSLPLCILPLKNYYKSW